jgi:hypothetical protein
MYQMGVLKSPAPTDIKLTHPCAKGNIYPSQLEGAYALCEGSW